MAFLESGITVYPVIDYLDIALVWATDFSRNELCLFVFK